MKDVEYKEDDFDRAHESIGNLIGKGVWGKGAIDELKKASENLDDVEEMIRDLDCDGAISFRHTSSEKELQSVFEDFEVLHRFSGRVGELVHTKIDQPFFEDLDRFVEGMRNLDASKFTTTNRIGATKTETVFVNSYTQEQREVPKTEVTMDDLFSGSNFYADELKNQFQEWKKLNPDETVSENDFRAAMLNTRAFAYTSIKDEQQKKEFWVNVIVTVGIVGVALFCPPAGLAIGAAYGSLELGTAISGKDWVSGRELETSERAMRGALSVADMLPAVKAFSAGIKGLPTGSALERLMRPPLKNVNDLVVQGNKMALTRIRGLKAALKEPVHTGKTVVKKELNRLGDSLNLPPRGQLAVPGVGAVPVNGNSQKVLKKVMQEFDLNLGGSKDGRIYDSQLFKQAKCNIDELIKYLENIEADLAKRFKETGQWPEDIQIPKSSNVLSSEGRIDWKQVPNGGYMTTIDGKIMKEKHVPRIKDVLDRYGPADGTYTSPVKNGVKYSYDERSLPFLEDSSKYHQYEVVGDFSNVKSYIDNCTNQELKTKVEATVKKYMQGDYSKLQAEIGKIAPGFDSSGGGLQIKLPLSVEQLEGLGLLKKIH
ncbi:hypothetical protein MFLO_11230 [Listeria floridensis FSL S10-1187]|uniref:TNT domain-containing protein n=1 Tax=Listeria floridensis FSL S10-1187 TaxID=1265817 RepID=A0ABP3AXJ3_9LIST|nr:glycohydrolase toxin TNT-related protein [Listeria floridensis]EUJ29155.1 hypothetical protein MFLO_11230 [Listeria floridensis FSL S10-1187]